VLELLDGQTPEHTGGVDLRGFEWHYWRRACHAHLPAFAGHAKRVTHVVFSPDGRRLASASLDGVIKVWDAAGGREVCTLVGGPEAVNFGGPHSNFGLSFSPDGRRLASVINDKTVKVWDLEGGGEPLTLEGHADWVNAVAFSPDGRRLATAGR